MKKNNVIFQTKSPGPRKGYFAGFSFSHFVAHVDKKFFSTDEDQHRTNSNVINDSTFTSLIKQQQQIKMLEMLNLSSSSNQLKTINWNFVISLGLILGFVLVLIILNIVVSWVEAPFRGAVEVLGSASEWVDNLLRGSNKAEKLTALQTTELINIQKDQIKNLTAAHIDLLKKYNILGESLEKTHTIIEYQSSLLKHLGFSVQEQIDQAISLQRKLWEETGFYSPLKKIWITAGASFFVYSLSIGAGVGSGLSVIYFLYRVVDTLAANETTQEIAQRVANVLNWTSWLGQGVFLTSLGVISIFFISKLWTNLNFYYDQNVNYSFNKKTLNEALAQDKISSQAYDSEVLKLESKYQQGEKIKAFTDSDEASQEVGKTFLERLFEILI